VIGKINAVHLRQNLGGMLNLFQYRNDSIVIHREARGRMQHYLRASAA
jgi:hypothetical protein